ncbi:hypothetical protein [Nocardia sp. NPDC056000]|uniref:hypothetical protein n=1 Tax=Nocardia sp. NPDC056000 TaxID=3345674 RepID=UPI0035DDA48E
MEQQRFAVGLGVTGILFAVAIGSGAPQAAADELAPGVSCNGYSCVNDTDDTYRIESDVECSAWTVMSRRTIHIKTYVAPHTTAKVVASCPMYQEPATSQSVPPTRRPDGTLQHHLPETVPGKFIPTYPQAIRYRSAQVDNNPPPPPTGSFG